jgi:hypothetical protein
MPKAASDCRCVASQCANSSISSASSTVSTGSTGTFLLGPWSQSLELSA